MTPSLTEAFHHIKLYLAVIPPWLQVVLSGYLAVVLAGMGSNRIKERRGLVLATVLLAIAAGLAYHAITMLSAMLL